MIRRNAEKKILQLAEKFKVIAIVGPRQSGKTTLVKKLFTHKPYASLETPDQRRLAINDPRAFLSQFPNGAVLDEIQRTPELFSYLQEIVDNNNHPQQYILTGSNNFLLQENITQSLAGRVAYITLLPFALEEIYKTKNEIPSVNEVVFSGFYPPLYDRKIAPSDWYPNYIHTYIERDVRLIKNISDLGKFELLIQTLAGRTGHELNINSLSSELGIDNKTIQSWISILESSFIIYILRPFFKNFNKILVKKPKLYFIDTGLVCSLLGINSIDQLQRHPLRGNLFETLIVIEILKKRMNGGIKPDLFFWRDKTGHEIDLVIKKANEQIPLEIKASSTVNDSFFMNLNFWKKLADSDDRYLVYSGDRSYRQSNGINITGWKDLAFSEI